MAELGSARRAVDEGFSGGSVNLENNWRRKEFMELSADVFKPESWRPVNPKCTAKGGERVRWAQPSARYQEHPPESKRALLATG